MCFKRQKIYTNGLITRKKNYNFFLLVFDWSFQLYSYHLPFSLSPYWLFLSWTRWIFTYHHIGWYTNFRTLPFKCAVYGCSNEFTDFESHQSATFKFHNFPTCERTRKQWLEACGLPEDTGTANAKICSDHFTLNDYSRKLREELLNPGYKRLLTDTAVPSVNFKPYSSLELNRLPTSPSEKLYQPPAKAPGILYKYYMEQLH